MVGAFILLLIPKVRKNLTILPFLCVAVFVGIWIDKGMALMLPGVTPTPIGEFVEYTPSHIELMVISGVWAIGFFLLTFMLKGAVGVLLGRRPLRGEGANPLERRAGELGGDLSAALDDRCKARAASHRIPSISGDQRR